MALSVDINANTRAAQAQVKDLGKALEGVSDSLDEMADEARSSGTKTERALDNIGDAARDTARDIDKAGDKLEGTFREMVQDAKKADRAIGDIGDTGSKSFGKVGDSASEVSDELRQNLGETFSSFRGDLEDLPQIAQDTLGGLAGSGALGGIPGLVATAVGAAGIGLLINAFDQAGEAQERLNEQASQWADTYIEAGSKVLTTGQIISKGLRILSEDYEAVGENAQLWGVSEETALAAMAGSPAAIDEVTQSLERKRVAAEKDAAQAQKTAEANGSALLSLTPLEQEYNKGKASLDELTGSMEKGAKQADTYSYFLRDLADNTAGATRTVDEFGDTIVSLPDGQTIYIDAETGQATDKTDAIEKKIYGIQDKTVNVKVTADTYAADAALAALQRKANKGINVVVNANTRGRIWE